MNKSDSERIAAALEKKGYKPASKENEADLILVNMCSVRQSAVDRVYGLCSKFKKLKKRNPKIKTVLTGCMLKKDKQKFSKIFDKISKTENFLKYQPKRQNNFTAFVPISNGCSNFCTYCVVPFTRGPLICRNHQEILKEIKNSVKQGFKEIWLLGQNVNDYLDKPKMKNKEGINFSKLIKMINDIPGKFKFFFISPNPKNFSEELINTMAKCEKFGKFLNLPVQSGSDQILKKMNRPYTAKQYKKLVKKIRKKIPDINLSTDIIVGFPGETKKQFEKTAKLINELKFKLAYISKYSPRPDTAAFKLKDSVSFREKKRREKCLIKLLSS